MLTIVCFGALWVNGVCVYLLTIRTQKLKIKHKKYFFDINGLNWQDARGRHQNVTCEVEAGDGGEGEGGGVEDDAHVDDHLEAEGQRGRQAGRVPESLLQVPTFQGRVVNLLFFFFFTLRFFIFVF